MLFQQKFKLKEQHKDFDLMFYIIPLLKVCVFVDMFYEHGLLKPTLFTLNPSNCFIKHEALLRAAVALTQLVGSYRQALYYG
jgi:hypothetical protein